MKTSLHRHSLKSILSQNFINCNGNTVGKIKRTSVIDHRNPDAPVAIVLEYLLGNSGALLSKHKPYIIFFLIVNLSEACPCLCREEQQILASMLRHEGSDIIILENVHSIPVIQSSPFHMLLVNAVSQRTNQMQLTCCRRTGSGDISSILWNLRLKENDIYLHETSYNQI